jgi:hypothetical protein
MPIYQRRLAQHVCSVLIGGIADQRNGLPDRDLVSLDGDELRVLVLVIDREAYPARSIRGHARDAAEVGCGIVLLFAEERPCRLHGVSVIAAAVSAFAPVNGTGNAQTPAAAALIKPRREIRKRM